MAEAWGAWQCTYSYKDWRGGVNAWVISETDTTATIRVEARYNSPYARQVNTTYAYTNCNGNNSGWVGTGGLNQPSNTNTTYVRRTQDYVIAKGSSGRNVWCAAGVQIGGTYSPGTSDAGVNVWINAISYKQPHPPKNQKVVKNSDWQATVSWTGDYTGMDGLYPWTGIYIDRKTESGGFTQIASVSWDKTSYVDKGITTGHSYQYGLRSYGPGGTSGRVTTSTITTSYTPNAPTSCSASRASDSQGKVTWKCNPATNRPYVNVLLERQTDSGSWTQIASLGSTTANYTDNGLSANHRYAYRVRAKNNAGYSGYATSGYIYTTPKAPSSVSVTKVSNTQVSVNITGAAAWATSYNVQYSLNGGSWTSAGSTTTWPYKHTPGGGTVKYRVQSVRSSLASGWVESGTVQTVMPPNAPSISLSPSASVVPVGTDVKVSWKPNHPDGSAQSSAQVEVTIGSASAVVHDVSGTATTYDVGAQQSAATIKVRVRTKGLDPDWGAWSSYATISIAVVPTGYFSYPPTDNAPVGGVPVDLSWSITDPAGVASQTLSLIGPNGTTVYQTNLSGSVRELSIWPDIYTFANLATYTASITVYSGSGLTATVTRSFRTSWSGPADPFPRVTYGDGLSASVTVGDSESVPALIGQVDRPAGSLLPGVTVYGNTRQNLWVNPSGTSNGITMTANADGSLTVSGTATGLVSPHTQTYVLRPGSTYTVSVDKVVQSSTDAPKGCFFLEMHDSDSTLLTRYVGFGTTTAVTFVVPDDTAFAAVGFYCTSGNTVSGTYRVMLNEGSEVEPWCPPGINSVDELSIVTSGKNLWVNPSGTRNGVTVTANSDGSVTVEGTSTGTVSLNSGMKYILKPSTTYTFSVDNRLSDSLTDPSDGCFFVEQHSQDGSVIPSGVRYVGYGSALSVTFTTSGELSYVYMGVFAASGKTLSGTYRVMLNVGETAAPWEPQASTTTPVDLNGHTLNSIPDGTRDELHIDSTGNVTLVKRTQTLQLDDRGSWGQNENPFLHYTAPWSAFGGSNSGLGPNGSILKGRCDKLPADTTVPNGIYSAGVNGSTAYLREPTFADDVTGVKAWMKANTPTVIMPLATPKKIDLGSIVMPELPFDQSLVFANTPVPADVMVTYPETDSFSVTRIAPDGSQWLVASGLTDGQQALDPLPPLNVDYSYVVTAYSMSGEPTSTSIDAHIDSDMEAYNFGVTAGQCVLLGFDATGSENISHSGETYRFALGPDTPQLPTFYPDGDIDVSGNHSYVTYDQGLYLGLRNMVRSRANSLCWFRDCFGNRARVLAGWSFSYDAKSYMRFDISVDLTEVVFTEPSNG